MQRFKTYGDIAIAQGAHQVRMELAYAAGALERGVLPEYVDVKIEFSVSARINITDIILAA
jgi:hypothetical protein